jgi:hypothetical protein
VLCDPSFAAPFDHGPQSGAVDEADVHLAAHVRGEQALEILESHSGRQRFDRYIDIGPLMKSARLHERAVDPHRRVRDMPGQGGAEKITGAIGKDRIIAASPFTF